MCRRDRWPADLMATKTGTRCQPVGEGRVFAVMPVYNRLAHTLECLRCLDRQTYPFISVIVADGGSTDGTVETLRRDWPHVEVLTSDRELWWSGAMKLGIEAALRESGGGDDFLLMVNNDTVLPEDYVETLVRVSRREDAGVAAVIVDSEAPSEILEAGVTFRWEDYTLHVRRDVPGDRPCFFEADVLPGRGTLIPLHMIRRVGNVAAERLPHYIADYELTHRMKRAGYRLGVTNETRLLSHTKVTGISPATGPVSLARLVRQLTHRRSMANLQDHLRFVASCAPPHLRGPLRRRLLRGALGALLFQTELRFVARPPRWALNLAKRGHLLRRAKVLVFGCYLIPRAQLEGRGLDLESLLRAGLLTEAVDEGWFHVASAAEIPRELRRIAWRLRVAAWNPLTKPLRWWAVHCARRSRRPHPERPCPTGTP